MRDRSDNIEGVFAYRNQLAYRLSHLRGSGDIVRAHEVLLTERTRPPYGIAKALRSDPNVLTKDASPLKETEFNFRGGENRSYAHYKTNEFYVGVYPEIANLGGVGLTVGSDQGLDFRIMAGLHEVHMIDIDPHTHLINRGYLEIGARFHKILGRYPTVEEFIDIYRARNASIVEGLLLAPSQTFTFDRDDVRWISDKMTRIDTAGYLQKKSQMYKNHTWIGSNNNLMSTIQAYERGQIHIYQGGIDGRIISPLAKELKRRKQQVSFIYTSNAPVHTKETLDAWTSLPKNSETRVLFSARVRNGNFEGAPKPQDFFSDIAWSFVVFRLKGARTWPNLYNSKSSDFIEINRGCYAWKKSR